MGVFRFSPLLLVLFALSLTLLCVVDGRSLSRASTIRSYLYYNHTEGSYRFTTSQAAGAYFVGPHCGSSDVLSPDDQSLWWSENGCSGPVVSASYRPSLAETGWDEISIETSARFDDRTQAYAAGYIEGYLTHDRIYALVVAILRNKPQDVAFADFLKKQDQFLRKKVSKHAPIIARYGTSFKGTHAQNPSEKSSYWFGISLILAQLDGMLAGYNQRASSEKQITLIDLWSLNDDGDRMDIDRALAAIRRGVTANTTAPATSASAVNQTASLSVGSTSKISKLATKARFAAKLASEPGLVSEMSKAEVLELVAFNGHCSALISLTEDDLIVGHNTWSDYDELLRSYKHFNFNFHHPSIRSQAVSFTSYPSFLWSSDDFVLTSRGSSLLVTETTITILDESLYKNHVHPEKGVMSWLRSILANRVASSAKEWVNTFKKHNSGTYNNQWQVIDMNKVQEARKLNAIKAKAANSTEPLTTQEKKVLKKAKVGKTIPSFGPGASVALAAPKLNLKKKSTRTKVGNKKLLQIPKESFYVLEQIPGHIEIKDMSHYLKRKGYFASYNLPFFPTTNVKGGYASLAASLNTSSLNYAVAPRAKLFAIHAPNVTSIDSMKTILRLNDYKSKNSISSGCPATAISSRYDLANLPGAICEIPTRRLNGAIDAKVTSASLVAHEAPKQYKGAEMLLISGPTFDSKAGIAPFDWNDSSISAETRRKMRSTLTATRFDFKWQSMRPATLKPLPSKQPKVVKKANNLKKKQNKLAQLKKKTGRTPLVPIPVITK